MQVEFTEDELDLLEDALADANSATHILSECYRSDSKEAVTMRDTIAERNRLRDRIKAILKEAQS